MYDGCRICACANFCCHVDLLSCGWIPSLIHASATLVKWHGPRRKEFLFRWQNENYIWCYRCWPATTIIATATMVTILTHSIIFGLYGRLLVTAVNLFSSFSFLSPSLDRIHIKCHTVCWHNNNKAEQKCVIKRSHTQTRWKQTDSCFIRFKRMECDESTGRNPTGIIWRLKLFFL